MLFDSHAHINSERFDEDRQAVAKAIEEGEISLVMDVGYDLESSAKAVEHAKKYAWCYAAVGCHPHDAKDMDHEVLLLFKGLARKPKVKAIGEIGLDFHYDHSPRDTQEHWFRQQIALALELNMPMIIHDREANERVLSILKEEGAFDRERLKSNGGEAKVLLHCFSGSAELAKQYVKLGATLSIAGPVTYKNAAKLIKVVETIPLENLLIETDSPYLTPEPHRGKRNTPLYVEHVARKISEIKGLTYEEVARVTMENGKRFFNII